MLFDAERWQLEILKTRRNYQTTIRIFTDQTMMRSLVGLQKIESYSIDYHNQLWEEQLINMNSPQFKEEFSVDEFLFGKSINDIRELARPLMEELESERANSLYDENLASMIPDDGTWECRRKICILEAFETINEYERSLALVSNQVLVLGATYFELIIKKFFNLVFIFYPEKMYFYIGGDHAGKISLKRVLKASSRQELLFDLAEEATSKALSGASNKKLKALIEITKNKHYSIEEHIAEEIDRMLLIRNEIIHENDRKTFLVPQYSQGSRVKEVEKMLDNLNEFISDLAHLAFYLYIPQNHFEPEDVWPESVLAEAYKKEMSEKIHQVCDL